MYLISSRTESARSYPTGDNTRCPCFCMWEVPCARARLSASGLRLAPSRVGRTFARGAVRHRCIQKITHGLAVHLHTGSGGFISGNLIPCLLILLAINFACFPTKVKRVGAIPGISNAAAGGGGGGGGGGCGSLAASTLRQWLKSNGGWWVIVSRFFITMRNTKSDQLQTLI